MNLQECLQEAIAQEASDVFIIAGLPLSYRKNGVICRFSEEKLLPADTESVLTEIYSCAGNRDMQGLYENGDDDFSFAIRGLSMTAPTNREGRCLP